MVTSVPFDRFVQLFLQIYQTPAYAPKTFSKMRRVLRYVATLGVESTADLTTATVAKYVTVRRLTVCANTLIGELGYLRAACAYALEEGWLERLPQFRRLRPRRSPPARITLHSIEAIGRVLDHLAVQSESWTGGRLYALASLAAHTGARRDEMLWSRVEDFDCSRGIWELQERRRLKTVHSAAPVPLCPELRAILTGWLPRTGSVWAFPGVQRLGPWHGGLCGYRPTDRLRQAGEACGVGGLTFASLRHTFATWSRRAWGLSDLELADVLRHTSTATQLHYLHQPDDHRALVASVGRVSYRRSA